MIQIYTGNGKGKTTAAMGLVLRALGHEMKICIVQFFKNQNFYGEQKILKKFKNLKFYSFIKKHPHLYPASEIKIKDIKKECEKAVVLIEKIMKEKKYDLLILDELNIVIRDKFIELSKIVKLLKEAPKEMEIVMTGRDANKKILKLADLITDMHIIKHPYYDGIKSRKGIDY
ncbi:MAG: cob(I)yrinic acid a,c-diamide adenosyltransferase [Elusimicrobiota bacterium]